MARPKMLTFRGVGLSADVGELEGVEGSTTVPVIDGVEGSTTVAVLNGVEGRTTVAVLDGVEGMTYRTGKSTTKSTMRHKSTKILPNPIMCELDLRHLQIHPEPVTRLLELCPRGNNKDVIIIILIHDNVYIPC
jgi:hypothetical protein